MGVDERGVPCYEDLYLDIVISPEGETLLLDVDELDEALRLGEITQSQYDFAWHEASALLDALEADLFPLLWLSESHHALLEKEIDRH
jgi:predicted RNA-binding protein associated with RNAse of E/G family